MAEILGIEPRLRVSKTPLLPLQYIPIKMKQCDGLHSPILPSHRVHWTRLPHYIKWWELLELNQLLRIFSATWGPPSPNSHKMFDNVYGWLTHSAQCKVVGLWTRYTSSICRKILETKTHTLSKLVGVVGLEPTKFSFWMKHGYPVTSRAHKIFCRLTWR